MTGLDENKGMYLPEMEHDACGIGFRAHMKGRKSHKIVTDAIQMLERMSHRGASGCDTASGDGAGILIQIPHEFLFEECLRIGFQLPTLGNYGLGMVFFPKDEKEREECREILNRKVESLGFYLLGYREVPKNSQILGRDSGDSEPHIEQIFVEKPADIQDDMQFERKLYVLRQYATKIIRQSVKGAVKSFYFASLSSKTVTYKGQLTCEQVNYYFPDLNDNNVVSAFAIIHSRFSTNTFPAWRLAQPFRYIAHNGEINTVKGNVNWIRAAESTFYSEFFSEKELKMILPICDSGNSDSANLDNVIELLYLSGRSLPHVMMMLIPEAWDGNEQMDLTRKAFYEYHASIMEPWDGPASISFTDGNIVGATLDRNGLRPSRYWVLDDETVIMASEVGVLDIDPKNVVAKGRLQPGKMFVLDMEQGRIIPDEELKAGICSRQPYQDWLNDNKIKMSELPDSIRPYTKYDEKSLLKRQITAGMTSEDQRVILGPMAQTAKEAIGSMGIDSPLAVLSNQSQHLSYYFKQLFAQVTNPPIDSIRERSIMSLLSFVGSADNILTESPKHCRQVQLNQPVLIVKEFDKLRFVDYEGFQAKTINTYFSPDPGMPGKGLEFGLNRICRYAEDAILDGFEILILSDRAIDSDHAPIPSLLATAAVHHHLIRKGLRGKVGILVESSDIWETHHFATLIGYGASGICPYLAFESLSNMNANGQIEGSFADEDLHKNYVYAVNKELLKIFSKMGISTLQSYRGAQIFECIGLNRQVVVERYFTGTINRIEGLGLTEIEAESLIRHRLAYPKVSLESIRRLEVGGVYQWKRRGEKHMFNPDSLHLLQQACRIGEQDFEQGYSYYKKYSKVMDENTRQVMNLRGLLSFKDREPIPLDDVESIENILKRFATGAMSFGSISWEAHTTLAIAMNRIGGRSNSGEGGEDEIRYQLNSNGDNLSSSIKQVASGRFGVTSYYLTNAKEIQIKMAQGAKPGEGGQLPGYKVDEWIGRVRHSTPGVGLISPPPHHDIYSIEDLAQLIFDLKNANRDARISVKLVSETGVGTVASGVAKAHADVILVSGYDGGTGASPLSSIRHAGLPWELGLAEAHQTLLKNGLRGRVVLQTDGQLRTGRDIVIASLLGAEEFGVATAALVAVGCILMRKCHLNTCPVGVATQDKHLRSLFSGKPEHVINMFKYMAMEVREIMAELGYQTIEEMTGQSQTLEKRSDISHWKYKNIDISRVLYQEKLGEGVTHCNRETQDHGIADVLDWKLIELSKPSLDNGQKVKADFTVNNLNRSIGAMISNEISKKYKGEGLTAGTIHFKFKGTAGQSFGAFSTKGLKLELEGDANDYFGKGLCGAELIVYPDIQSSFKASENMAVGNVSFYGATSGEAFIRGLAGERFCVRNSGAMVVVEGVGDHGCEYMTGGQVIILGSTGRNFAAGMSGGLAYVWDKNADFKEKCNVEMVDLDPINTDDESILKDRIGRHFENTKSEVAKHILENWSEEISSFVKVFPKDYKQILIETKQIESIAV